MSAFRAALLACSLALPVSAAFAGPPTRHKPDPGEVGARVTLLAPGDSAGAPMDLSMGQPVVDVYLNGRGPYRMFLDTGAGTTVVDSALAAELGLEKVGETRIGDPANPQAIAANIVAIDTLRVGGAAFVGLRAASWNRSMLRRVPNPPLGVIGFPVWRELLLTLDYPAAQVRLARGSLPPADGASVIGYTDEDGIPSVPVRVGDTTLVAHLDTGSAGFLSIPARDTSRVRFAGPLREMGRGRTVNSTIVFLGGTLAGDVGIGAQRFEHPVVMVNDVLPGANLGGRALRDFVLTFDQRAKRLRIERTRVSPPEAFAPPVRTTSAPH